MSVSRTRTTATNSKGSWSTFIPRKVKITASVMGRLLAHGIKWVLRPLTAKQHLRSTTQRFLAQFKAARQSPQQKHAPRQPQQADAAPNGQSERYDVRFQTLSKTKKAIFSDFLSSSNYSISEEDRTDTQCLFLSIDAILSESPLSQKQQEDYLRNLFKPNSEQITEFYNSARKQDVQFDWENELLVHLFSISTFDRMLKQQGFDSSILTSEQRRIFECSLVSVIDQLPLTAPLEQRQKAIKDFTKSTLAALRNYLCTTFLTSRNLQEIYFQNFFDPKNGPLVNWLRNQVNLTHSKNLVRNWIGAVKQARISLSPSNIQLKEPITNEEFQIYTNFLAAAADPADDNLTAKAKIANAAKNTELHFVSAVEVEREQNQEDISIPEGGQFVMLSEMFKPLPEHASRFATTDLDEDRIIRMLTSQFNSL